MNKIALIIGCISSAAITFYIIRRGYFGYNTLTPIDNVFQSVETGVFYDTLIKHTESYPIVPSKTKKIIYFRPFVVKQI